MRVGVTATMQSDMEYIYSKPKMSGALVLHKALKDPSACLPA